MNVESFRDTTVIATFRPSIQARITRPGPVAFPACLDRKSPRHGDILRLLEPVNARSACSSCGRRCDMTGRIREAAKIGAIGATVITLSSLAMAQQPVQKVSSTASGARNDKTTKASKDWAPPRTAWGDPDLQGTYTNKDESGIPFERSNQFDGKALADVDDVELAELIRERQKQISERAPLAGGETGAGPVDWYENYDAKNSRAWLVVDPPDGRIPPQTAEATRRAAALAAARGVRGSADAAENRSLYDRCITRGLPGSMMPAIYGNSYQIVQAPGYVAIRYEMVHETRLIPLDGRPHAG